MRLLTLAAILLLSSLSFSQHGGSSSPAPSPAPAAAPAPAASPSPSASSAASSAAASSSASHSSPPSPPSAPPPSASFPSHSAPVVNSSPAAPSRSVDSNSARTAPVSHTPDSNSERVMPAERVSDEGKIVPSARIGERPVEKPVEKKEGEEKSAESNLKRPCHGEDCKEPLKKPEHVVSDLQRPGCIKEPCPCPRGQVAGKRGCTTPAEPVVNTQCSVGFSWSGSACVASESCAPGQIRRGADCEADCSAANAMAQSMIPQVRSARRERDDACRQDPSGTSCSIQNGRYQGTLGEYQNLWASSPVECRATLPVPDTL